MTEENWEIIRALAVLLAIVVITGAGFALSYGFGAALALKFFGQCS